MTFFDMMITFIHVHFFYDLRSSVISICVLLMIYFLNKLWKDKGEKPIESLKLLVETTIPLVVMIAIY